MKISDINPHIRYARLHRSFSFSSKKNSICYDCRVFYIEGATGFVTANGTKYQIESALALYLPPETRYKFSIKKKSEEFKIVVIDFDLVNSFSHLEQSLGTATEDTFDPSIVPRYPLPSALSSPIAKQFLNIKQNLLQCTDQFLSGKSFFRETASAFLKLCLLEFIKKNQTSSAHAGLCERVIAFIQENYQSSALTNEDIALRFGYNAYHLSRIMKEETGRTLHQYLIYYRIRIAKNYLLTTEYDMDEISYRSGFCTSAYFIKIFRTHVGMTPKKYRDLRVHTEL